MDQGNLTRMIALAEEFFETKGDPDQIAVSEDVIERLKKIHPATLGELRDDHGPIAWMLIIPTTRHVMDRFIAGEISERALLELTERESVYDSAYLCSALVLPEYRRQGLARQLALEALQALMKEYSITALYYWAFSEEGSKFAEAIAEVLHLPVFRRRD